MQTADDANVRLETLLDREWLIPNARGGFACSTAAGLNTRKYHGLLAAAMLPPGRRMMILSRVEDTVLRDGWPHALSCNEYPGKIHPEGHRLLRAFDPRPWPRWAYQSDGWTIQKELRLVRGHNIAVLSYTLLGADKPVELELRPLFALRPIHELSYQWNGRLDAHPAGAGQWHIAATTRTPEVFFAHGGAFDGAGYWYLNTIYRREKARGYAGLEDLWMPGTVRWTLNPGQTVHFACSTEPIDLPKVIDDLDRDCPAPPPGPLDAETDPDLDAMLRAGEVFIVHGRDAAPAIIDGYPWHSASGRGAMIAMAGLLLAPGRLGEARGLLTHMASHEHHGLLPTTFSASLGPSHDSADTALWFVNAVAQYLDYAGDRTFVHRHLAETIDRIIDHYIAGTDLGIKVADDGLLECRGAGAPATWMDARVGDIAVTPRAGMPVELSALWHNALLIAADLADDAGRIARAAELRARADLTRQSFNAVFWNDAAHCCFDVIDGQSQDASIRPNQILAVSLRHPVLAPHRWDALVETVRVHLLTPVGLRTLAPTNPSYAPRCEGDVAARERALHNGTVHPWLIGPYVDALRRCLPPGPQSRAEIRRLLSPLLECLAANDGGRLPELFDADPPHRPGGCIASARSVGELTRAYVDGALDPAETRRGDTRRIPLATIVMPQRVID